MIELSSVLASGPNGYLFAARPPRAEYRKWPAPRSIPRHAGRQGGVTLRCLDISINCELQHGDRGVISRRCCYVISMQCMEGRCAVIAAITGQV